MTFRNLGLVSDLLRAVTEQGYIQPTPIQQQAIPAILQGQDIFASAQTGTGKTASFTLPLLQRLGNTSRPRNHAPRALILTPTRELAAQVSDSVKTYGNYLPLRSAVVYGGISIRAQIQTLRQGVDILVATPGRLLDLVEQKSVDLSQIEILVLDECDRMLDMGFIRDIRRILAKLPHERQTLMFSATISKTIEQLANTLLKSPTLIEVASRNTASEQVQQVVHPVERNRKRELLAYMISFHNWKQVLVFTRTKHGASRLAEQLAKDGLKTAAIHGNKSQAARTKALNDFKQGKVRVLVATDVASRGLDIEQLPHVVNFELPNVAEDYVHRIGRTGRAGKSGRAVSLVCFDEYPLLVNIEKLLNQTLFKQVIPGYEPTSPAEPGLQTDITTQNVQADQPKRQRSKQRRSSWANNRTQSKPKPTQKSTDAKSRDQKRLRTR
jgi:ATP-dependent RNA helicase RhlE